MEDQTPPKSVPPLWQPSQLGNVLQTMAHIAWLTRIMRLREIQIHAPPIHAGQSDTEVDFIPVPSNDKKQAN